MTDPRARFSETVEDYDRHRPSYPAEALDWVARTAALAPGAAVLDLGCGTGILTRLLAGRGYRVTGVDPNPQMLARARELGGGASYRPGEAIATGLPGGTFDLAIGAQSFHWFDLEPAWLEIRRVLRPGGWCAALWNERESTPLLDEYERLLRAASSEYRRVRTPAETLVAIRALPCVGHYRESSFANAQRFGLEGLLGRAHSASYVVHGVADLAAFDREIEAIFARHQRDGEVEFRYRTIAALWRSTPADAV